MSSEKEQQNIKTLKRRYEELNKKKISAETEKRNSGKRLVELQKKARDSYGTDSLEELEKKLKEMKETNERRRSEYQEHLDQLESSLKRVEQRHKAAEG